LHGALLDAEILADVYLAMTGGQTTLQLSDAAVANGEGAGGGEQIRRLPGDRQPLPVVTASAAELAEHEAQLNAIAGGSGGKVLWRELAGS
jgi:DNA polymerase-3 subunit epsilon